MLTHVRILFLDHVGDLGGAELCLLELSSRLKDSCEVLLLQPGPLQDLLEERGVTQRFIQAPERFVAASREGGLSQAAAFGSVLGLARQVATAAKDFDVIVANSQKAFVVAALAGRLGRTKVVWYLHDILSAEHFSRFNRKLTTYLANQHARGVLANSKASETAFRAGGGHADVKIVYNGFSAEPFDGVSETEVAALRRDLHLDSFTVGIFGRLSPWKGQDVFLKALAQTEGIEAVIVGEALFGEEDFAANLRTFVKDLGLQERVRFLGFRSDIPRLMKTCDVVVHASTAPEPFGRVIVEGMLASRAVIAAGAGGVTEILEHEQTGLLVSPNDPSALAAALQRLQNDEGLRSTLANAGRRHAEATFSHEAAVGALRGALESWL